MVITFGLKRKPGKALKPLTAANVRQVERYLDSFSTYLKRVGIITKAVRKAEVTSANYTTYQLEVEMLSAYKAEVKPTFQRYQTTNKLDSALRNSYVVDVRSVSS